MHGPAVPRRGDFVENCLENLSGKPRRDNDEIEMDDDFDEDSEEGTYYYDNPGHPFSIDDQQENTTIVGTKLHGPTFDGDYEEESEEVSPVVPSPFPSTRFTNTSSPPKACHSRMAAPKSASNRMAKQTHTQRFRARRSQGSSQTPLLSSPSHTPQTFTDYT